MWKPRLVSLLLLALGAGLLYFLNPFQRDDPGLLVGIFLVAGSVVGIAFSYMGIAGIIVSLGLERCDDGVFRCKRGFFGSVIGWAGELSIQMGGTSFCAYSALAFGKLLFYPLITCLIAGGLWLLLLEPILSIRMEELRDFLFAVGIVFATIALIASPFVVWHFIKKRIEHTKIYKNICPRGPA